MADTVTSQTIQDGERVAVLKFTNESDGTGEASVKKVDVSTLTKNSAGETCTGVSIGRIYWATRGMAVDIEFDASTNVLAIPLPADSTGDAAATPVAAIETTVSRICVLGKLSSFVGFVCISKPKNRSFVGFVRISKPKSYGFQ